MIHCIGDSHVCVFSGVDRIGGNDILPFFKTYRLGPHTAYNLNKRKSLIDQIIKAEVRPGNMIMFCFGEIDCRVHLLKESELQHKPLDSVVCDCVERYFDILRMVKQHGFPLLVWNVPPSSRVDVVSGEYSTYGSCKQRNYVSRLFNEFLQKKCEDEGIAFISIFDKLIDKDGLTNTAYYMDSIHLSQKVMPLILEDLSKKVATLANRAITTTLMTDSELNLWQHLLPTCKTVFDVGVRDDTTILGLYPDITFHVFEPNPVSFRKLSSKLSAASNVVANNVALGNTTGKLSYYSDTESIARRTHHTTSRAVPQEIDVVRLDDYCACNQISQIDFLKIDTEGFELEVMKGGTNIIHNSCRFIQFEYGGTYLDMNIKLQDIYDWLPGWRFYRITDRGLTFMPSAIDDYQYCNYLATKEDVLFLFALFTDLRPGEPVECGNSRRTTQLQDARRKCDVNSLHTMPADAMVLAARGQDHDLPTNLDGNHILEFQNIKSSSGLIRPQFLSAMATIFGLDTFVETGTFRGDTTLIASDIFTNVYTVELSPELHRQAQARLADRKNIQVLQGDSAEVFPRLLSGLKGNILFWLDGHYSGAGTAQGDDNTPIVKEFMAIKNAGITNAVILIDDLRMFDNPWDCIPDSSAIKGYPTAADLVKLIHEIDNTYQIAVLGDVLMAFPTRGQLIVSPVVSACTISRLSDGNSYELNKVIQGEETIGAALHEERTFLQELPTQFGGSEVYGLGRHYRLWRALIYAADKRYDDACKEFLIAINLGCAHWRVHWYIANAALEAGFFTLAAKSCDIVLQAAPAFPDTRKLQQRVLIAAEKRSERRFALNDRLEIAAHLLLSGKDRQADEELQGAITDGAQETEAYYRYSKILMQTAQFEPAIVFLQKVISLCPAHSNALNDLGIIAHKQGDLGKAMEYFGTALSINDLNYQALQNALTLANEMGIGRDALGMVKEIVQRHPDDAILLNIIQTFLNRIEFKDREIIFGEFVHSIHPQTIKNHDEILNWAYDCEKSLDKFELCDLYANSADHLARNGYALACEIKDIYRNRLAAFTDLRILIHLPPLNISPGGNSLFSNMLQALNYTGISVRSLDWNEPIENVLKEFRPTVFMTSDHQLYLSRINWEAVKEYKHNYGLIIGLTASLQEYGNTPLAERLQWCREHNVDFFYSFRAPEYLNTRKEYRPFFDSGYKIFSIEFGANPLIHYPVPNIKKDIDYIFLASSNTDKWDRYFAYLSGIFSKYAGFIDGPGWGFQHQLKSLNKDRYLYARAKIGLNLHLNEQIQWPCELNERTYILAACGIPQLIDSPLLLSRRFDENGFFIADSPEKYNDLFQTILNNPAEAEKRALIAQKEVFQSHTWFHRAEGFVLNLIQEFFGKSSYGLVYGSNLYHEVNSSISGKVGRVGGSVGQLLKYDRCDVEDINLEDGGFGKADDGAFIIDMHDAYRSRALINKYDNLISSNVIEHSYNPVLLLLNFYLVTKKNGWQFHAIPNHRYTYDVFRKPTSLEHIIEDFEYFTNQTDLTHVHDYIQSAIVKHGWQKEFHKKYPVAYPYIHNHVFDEHNTKQLMEFMFQDATVDLIKTKDFSDNVVLFRNQLKPSFVEKYRETIRKYSPDFLPDTSELTSSNKPEHVGFVNSKPEEKARIMNENNDGLISQISKAGIWQEGSPLRLHLGCGEQHLNGYVNIDYPPSEHTFQTSSAADIFADITSLSFPDHSVNEIRLHHVFEHFNRSVALALLIKWNTWLKIDGILHIETPDLIGSAKTLLSNASWSTKMGVVRHIAGSHEAAWACHVDHWFPERFEHTLHKLGYEVLETRSTSWTVEPYLSNVTVTAVKKNLIPIGNLLRAADELLWESTVALSEKNMHYLWKNEMRKNLSDICDVRTSDKTRTGVDDQNMKCGGNNIQPTTGIIFSKDRAMQLDCTLRTFFLYCRDTANIHMKVIYKASSDFHERQYSILKQAYPSVEFISETNFHDDLLAQLEHYQYVLYIVDDNIFIRDFQVAEAVNALEENKNAIGFSLRLGTNTIHCYMLTRNQTVPAFDRLENGVIRFNWTKAKLDFAYPLELSSSLYRIEDILPVLEKVEFSNPNILELQMDTNKGIFAQAKPLLLSFEQSVAFCNPVNMVQTMWVNKVGQNNKYSPQNLAELFDQDYRIDPASFAGIIPNSCHQEVEFIFTAAASLLNASQQRIAENKPVVTIGILNFNGIQHIKPCLESIRRNTPQAHEVIVVDNGSTDESREYLHEQEDIILVENPENIGAPAARNQFIAIARGDYIVFLDNDTIVTKDWVKKLVAHMESDPQIGIIGACSNYASGPQMIGAVSYENIEELEKFAKTREREHKGELVESPRLISFCVFMRRAAVDKIGAMETGFSKFCFEDDDYSMRITIAGFKSVVANDVFIHHTGGPQGRGDSQYNKWLVDAWDKFKHKWGLPADLPFGSSYDLGKIVHQTFDPKVHHIDLPSRLNVEALISSNYGKKIKRRAAEMVSIIIRVSSDTSSAKKCFRVLHEYTKEPYEVIFIVHSNPAEKWVKEIVRKHKNCKYVVNVADLGFARESNQGILESIGEYILLLDEGVRVTDGWLSGMMECTKRSASVGIVGPMIGNTDKSRRKDISQFVQPYIENAPESALDFEQRNRNRRIKARDVSGVCMLFSYDLIDKIGFFDEKLGSGNFEDDDFCLRAAIESRASIIAGDVIVYQEGKKSFQGNRKPFLEKWGVVETDTDQGKKFAALRAMELAREKLDYDLVDEAINEVMDGISKSPDEISLYYFLTQMLLGLKRFEDALAALKSLPETAANDIRLMELTAYAREGLNLDEEAGRLADQILDSSRENAAALNLKGMLARKQGKMDTAENFFQEAIKSDPGYGSPYTNLGDLKWTSGHQAEALTLLERGFILSPLSRDHLSAYHGAASLLKEFDRAVEVFREAKQLYPKNKKISFLLIDLLIQKNDFDAAMTEIENAIVAFGIDDDILQAALAIRTQIGVREIAGDKKHHSSLAVCMIVKNEEQHLVRCLTSIKPIASEIIIVDTGSMDRTKDIALAFGAKVYDFDWTNNFADARNFSIKQAGAHWILVHDADEVISPLDYAALKDLLRKKKTQPAAYSMITRNYSNSYPEGWTANDGHYREEEAGKGWHPTTKVRLFVNDQRIRFEGHVHEVVEPALLRAGIKIVPCSIPIHHYGRLDAERTNAKSEEYYILGKKKLRETGDNPRALRELAVQAGELGRREEAIDLWKRLISIDKSPQIQALALFNMGSLYFRLGKYEDALAASKKARELDPHRKENTVTYACSELCIGDVTKAIPALAGILKKSPDYPPALASLAVAHIINGNKEDGIDGINKLRTIKVNVADYLNDFAGYFINAGRDAQAVTLLEASIENSAIHAETYDLLSACRERLTM